MVGMVYRFTDLQLIGGDYVRSQRDRQRDGDARSLGAPARRQGHVQRPGQRRPEDGSTNDQPQDVLSTWVGVRKGKQK